MEKLFLRLDFSAQELNVVNQQHIGFTVAALECRSLVITDGVDELIRELLGTHITNVRALVQGSGVVTNRMEKVRRAEPGSSVDEQRVVGTSRLLSDRNRRGVREAVTRADNEGVEDVLVIEPTIAAAGVRGSGTGARRSFGSIGWHRFLRSSATGAWGGVVGVGGVGHFVGGGFVDRGCDGRVDGDRQADVMPDGRR